jgi:hypothetical protein
MSVRSFARYLGAGVRTVAAWDADPAIVPRPELQAALDTALTRATADEQHRFTVLLECVRPAGVADVEPRSPSVALVWRSDLEQVYQNAARLWTVDLDPERVDAHADTAIHALMLRWLVATPEPTVARRGHCRRIGGPDVERLRRVRQDLKAMDNAHGGGAAFPMAVAYLRREAAPLLDGEFTDATGRALLSAIAELVVDLGWMAYDAGDHVLGRAYMAQSLRLAHAAGERLLGGRVLCAMSHQALHIGQISVSVDLARAARTGAEHFAPPRAVAMFAAMEAMAHAAARDTSSCTAALRHAEAALSRAGDDAIAWLEFDEGGFLGHAARAQRYLKRGKACERLAAQAIETCLHEHGRTRAQRQAILAAAYVQQGKLDQAAATGEQVVKNAWRLNSRHVDEEIAGLVSVVERRNAAGTERFLTAAREYLVARSVR